MVAETADGVVVMATGLEVPFRGEQRIGCNVIGCLLVISIDDVVVRGDEELNVEPGVTIPLRC